MEKITLWAYTGVTDNKCLKKNSVARPKFHEKISSCYENNKKFHEKG